MPYVFVGEEEKAARAIEDSSAVHNTISKQRYYKLLTYYNM